MAWVLRLVETGIDSPSRVIDVLDIKPRGDLGDITTLGLTLSEAKLILARLQQAVVAVQADDHAVRRPVCSSCSHVCHVRLWAARCSRSPPLCRCGSADTPATTARSMPRNGRASRSAARLLARTVPSRAVPGIASASGHDGSCRGNRSTGCDEIHSAAHGSGSGDELVGRQGHRLLVVVIPIILPAEADLPRRHGEHDVKIRHLEQFRLPILEPLPSCETLALRTVTRPDMNCTKRADGRNRRTIRRDRRAPRCGNSRSRSWHAAARRTAMRCAGHGTPGRSGGTRPPLPALRGPREPCFSRAPGRARLAQ